MTKDEFRKVLDEQSAVSERMHEETGAPLVTVPRPGGMQPNKPAERPDGWYWVKNTDSKWVVMELQGGIAYSRGSVFKLGPGREIGPRIPSPDEPATRDAAII